ncbi:uncharacterized protein LOC111307988 [Durio zibethinus]|uniref:Uncharacterized protein LOC111307988 n=1 Tax=Durio zibethinus TaxID=66656 RepID=A0A6P6AB22_DURZI|nr:uncharacterized protein LOC111307988 [Durio zibethinus]
MRMITYLFLAYKSVGFNLFRGCSSFSKPWLERCCPSHLSEQSINKISGKKHDDDDVDPVPWDKLPVDILKLIFDRLHLKDRIRFNLVCKQWRTNTTETPQLLWLMLPYHENSQHLSFFDMSEGKVHKLNLPKSAQGGWFCGCSKGWLFLAKGSEFHNLQFFLFDPISRVQIPLPPLSTIPEFGKTFTIRQSKWNPAACIITQVVVSSSDASQCILAATFCANDDNFLALCRPQDERWTIVDGLLADGHCYLDIYFFNGELYACFAKTNNLQDQANLGPFPTHSVTLGGHDVNLKLIPFICPPIYPSSYAADVDELSWYYKDCAIMVRLVESNGQLFMVTKICDIIETSDYDDINEEDEDEDNERLLTYHQTARFEVSKIQITDTTFTATRLSNLSDQSLFVGDGVSLAGNFNEFDKNCIYFLEENDIYSLEDVYPLSRESGIFYLDDGSIKRSFPSIKTDRGSYMNWFSPNIKTGAFF